MNTATRAIGRAKYATSATVVAHSQAKNKLSVVVIVSLVLLSAFAIVYVKDLNRRLFIQYQQQQATNNQLNVEHGKLMLEQSTWSSQERMQRLAQNKLAMQVPAAKDIVLIQEK